MAALQASNRLMKIRPRPLLLLVAPAALAAALTAPGALADNQAVVATVNNTFVAKEVAVRPGEIVTFTNQGGDHNVVWEDGTPPQPPQAVPPAQWPAGGVSRTFTQAGRFRYFCVAHGSRGGFGMAGTVYVNTVGLVPPKVTGLTASATRTGVRVRFRSTRAGRARATFFRRVGRRFVRDWASSFAARQGANSKRIAQRLSRGGYRVELQVTDANRLRSDKRTKGFSVR
jgi:plastocyanin